MKGAVTLLSVIILALGMTSVVNAAVIIIDDPEATVIPNRGDDPTNDEWALLSTDQAYLDSFLYKERDAAGQGQVVWTVQLDESADYQIYAWWDDSNSYSYTHQKFLGDSMARRSQTVPYKLEISADGNAWIEEDSYTVDQTISGPGGGNWQRLGTESYYLPEGTWARVILSDDAQPATEPGKTTWVVADAVKFSSVPIPGTLWLLSSGLAGIFAFRRRNRQG